MMKKTFVISILLLSSQLSLFSIPKSTTPPRNKESGWTKNGKPMSDTNNIKSKNGFGVQMWIINNESFFDDWNKPETPNLTFTETAIRNEKVFIIFLFIHPSVNKALKSDVAADVLIKSPDGETYAHVRDLEIWKREFSTPQGDLQLGVDSLGLIIEEAEPLGTYSIEATVKDRISDIVLTLKTDLIVK